jgi:hypothetical protein
MSGKGCSKPPVDFAGFMCGLKHVSSPDEFFRKLLLPLRYAFRGIRFLFLLLRTRSAFEDREKTGSSLSRRSNAKGRKVSFVVAKGAEVCVGWNSLRIWSFPERPKG